MGKFKILVKNVIKPKIVGVGRRYTQGGGAGGYEGEGGVYIGPPCKLQIKCNKPKIGDPLWQFLSGES